MRNVVVGWLCVIAVATAGTAGPGKAVAWAGPVAYVPPPGTLSPGMHGTAIRKLQRRLADLHYYPGPVNGKFGNDTEEAVWAFQETQRLPASNDVGRAMGAALVHPRSPKLLVPKGASSRVEVNLADKVLVLYRHSKVKLISHISAGGGYHYHCPAGVTCGPAITPDGNFRAISFAPGWMRVPLGKMYNPVFFLGDSYAIHGDIPVPLQPASHGCVRIPMDVAGFFYRLIHISPVNGTPVYIRGEHSYHARK